MIAARPAMAQEAPAAAQSAEAYLAEAQAAMDSMLANAEEFRAEGDCATVQAILETIQALIKSEREAHPEYPSSLFDALQAQLDGAAAPECPWSFGEPAEPDMALTLGDLGLQLVLDSEDWCEYGPAQPQGETPGDGPGGDPSRGSSPSSPGSTSRGSPPAMPELSDWDDLQQWIDETNAWLELQPDSVRNAVFSDWWESVRDPVADAEFAAAVSALRAASDNARNDDPADAPEDAGDPNDAPTVTLIVKATGAAQTGVGQAATGRQQVKLFADSVQNVALPSEGGDRPQTDAGADPLACTTDEEGQCEIDYALDNFDALIAGMDEAFADAFVDGLSDAIEAIVNPSEVTSYTLEVAAGTPISVVLQPYTISTLTVGDSTFVTLMAPTGEVEAGWIQTMAGYQVGVIGIEVNICRDKQPGPPPPDPLMQGAGSWGQQHDDQWAIKRVGLTLGADSAWTRLGPDPQPVTVAVIDTGLDWNHLDFSYDNIWKNPGETPDNGVDDDGNGYVDDIIGWDFMAGTNNPWDHDGHGTIVAGIIAADGGNDIGMAGINPHARIMVLKALNAFGHTRASYVAEAVVYAADNGARVINLSVGGPTLTRIETAAIAHARARGVVVVVAAGNEGVNVAEFGLAGADGVLTVGATNLDDSHPNFSNWGAGVDIAAPGVDVLSLRARRTDTMLGIKDVPYEAGAAYVGEDRRYYRVSGTSFSTPIVAGVASLVLSARPELTAEQVEAILVQSAEDIQTPGVDQFSGAGMVDARAALAMDPAFRIEASITGLEVVQGAAGPVVRVQGSAGADRFGSARIEVGRGERPTAFTPVLPGVAAATGALGDIPADAFRGAAVWTVRLVVTHADGRTREARYVLDVGG